MKPEAKQRIVLIQADFGDGKRSFGTGFRLKAGRILTSQHVVQRREDGVTSKATRIRVARFRGHDKEPEISDAKEMWAGAEELTDAEQLDALDVVILADGLDGSALRPFHHFVVACRQESDRWDAAGFPRIELRKIFMPVEIGGGVNAFSDVDGFLDLTNERRCPVDDEGKELKQPWAGMSGAPVFLRDGRLYGVIRRTYDALPTTLHAVPVPLLLRDPDFRRHLELDGDPAQTKKIIDLLRSRLRGQDADQRDVAGWVPAWREAYKNAPSNGLEALLAAMEVSGSLADVSDVLARFEARKGRLKEIAALCLALMAGRMAPARLQGRDLEISMAAANLAELAVAYHDGRAPDFVEVPGDRPVARLRAPLVEVEAGFGEKQREKDQIDLLEDYYLSTVLGDAPWLLPSEKKDLEALPEKLKREIRLDMLRRRFRRMNQKLGAAPYVVVDWFYRERLGAEAEPFLKRLNKLFPDDFRHIHLTGEIRRLAEENDLLEPFLRLVGVFPE